MKNSYYLRYTGLSSMYYLLTGTQDYRVDIFEKSDRAGGKVKTYPRWIYD